MTNKTLSQELAELAKIEPQTTGILSCTSWKVQNIKDCSECKYECEDKKFPDFENNNDNFVRLLSKMLKVCDNFTFCTDTDGLITIDWFHQETQLEEEYLDIGDTLITAIIKSSIKILDYPYVGDQLKQSLQSENWSY